MTYGKILHSHFLVELCINFYNLFTHYTLWVVDFWNIYKNSINVRIKREENPQENLWAIRKHLLIEHIFRVGLISWNLIIPILCESPLIIKSLKRKTFPTEKEHSFLSCCKNVTKNSPNENWVETIVELHKNPNFSFMNN